MSLPLKNMGLPMKNFVKIKPSPPKNPLFFYSTPKEILNVYNLPVENSMVPQLWGGGGGGGADIKCNSPKSSDPASKTHSCFQIWPQFFKSWVMLSAG